MGNQKWEIRNGKLKWEIKMGTLWRLAYVYILYVNVCMSLNCIIYYLGDYIYIDPELYLGGRLGFNCVKREHYIVRQAKAV